MSAPENPARSRWKHRPPHSNWGEFGPDDQLGRLNLITREKVLQGVAEVKEGITFCLSLPLDYPGGNLLNPRRYPPELRPTQRDGRPNMNYALADKDGHLTDVVCDDAVLLHLQYSTQWDSFAHVGSLFDADGDGQPEKVYYNGYRAGEHVLGPDDLGSSGKSAALALGIENMAAHGVQGRGVMVDLHAHFGRARHFVDYDALHRVMEADKVEIEPGDMLCLHTEFAEMVLEMERRPSAHRLENSCAVLDGRDGKLLNWITDSGVAVLISDNYAVEGVPSRPCDEDQCASMPLHEHCLFKNGIHLGEIWHLTPLARWLRGQGRNRFLLTAPPLRLPGAVGSPATPIATV
jgi:hypothetical protein